MARPLLNAAGVIGLILVGLSCRAPETEWIAAPIDVPGARSVVYFVEWSERLVASAHTADTSSVAAQFPLLEWTNGPPPSFRVTAAYYEQSLVELEIAPGRMEPTTEPRPCLLNTPLEVLERREDDGRSSEWASADLSERQQAFLTTGPDSCVMTTQCRPRRVTEFVPDSERAVTRIIKLDERRALMAQKEGRFNIVDASGLTPQPQLDGLPSLALAISTSGELIFGGDGGRVAFGSLEGPFTHEVVDGEPNEIVALAVAEDAPDRIYALGLRQDPAAVALYRRDDRRWQQIWTSSVSRTRLTESKLQWVEGETVVGVYGGQFLLRTRLDEQQTVVVESISAVPRVAGLQPEATALLKRSTPQDDVFYLGSSLGQLLQTRDPAFRTWTGVASSAVGRIIGLAEIPEGLVLGGLSGAVQFFFFDEGLCPSGPLSGSDNQAIVGLGDLVVVTGENISRDNPATVTFLR